MSARMAPDFPLDPSGVPVRSRTEIFDCLNAALERAASLARRHYRETSVVIRRADNGRVTVTLDDGGAR